MREESPATPRVLVVEDEDSIANLLRVALTYEGYEVVVESDGRRGFRRASEEEFSLVILDLMLPGLDGMEICKRLRAQENEVPVIMLTARAEVTDRVAGLRVGADDYVTKPFDFGELIARMEAVMRRKGGLAQDAVIQAGDLRIDVEAHTATRGDEQIELTKTEFALLELFMRNPNRVFDRETLLNRIWGYDYPGKTNIVDVHVSHLRKKLERPASGREVEAPRRIHTVYGRGYAFRPEEKEEHA